MTQVKLTDDEFAHCNLDQLVKLKGKLESELEKREIEKVETCRQQILAISKSSGLTLLELVKPLLEDQAYFVKKRHVAPALPVVYRHPENSTWTWTGKGRKPLWFSEYLAKGGKLESLWVKESKPS